LVAGRYELGRLLGSGGFASVYRAHDTAAGRDVALKVIPVDTGGPFERFRQEALAVSRLRSRHVARVHDFGRDPSFGFFIAMDFVEGLPLEVGSFGRALLPHEVLRAARGILDALADAHASGIVHRDVKPSNVLVPRVPSPLLALDDIRVLDFGIARSMRRAEVLAAIGSPDTQAGVVLGTPAYMAPEQLRDAEVGPQADVYSAGLVLFELLEIGSLFGGTTLRDELEARLARDPELDDRVPHPLSSLLARMLARDPAARFAQAAEALAAIADLETAPVVVRKLLSAAPLSVATRRTGPRRLLSDDSGSRPRIAAHESPSSPPPSVAPSRFAFGARRITRLDDDPLDALREALHAADLPMIDALARRERGTDTGRAARAVALAMRLELEAAALVLEPVSTRAPVARAVAATLVAPRARSTTRARLEVDRDEKWLTEIPAPLAATLVAMATSLTPPQDGARNAVRARRVLDQLDSPTGSLAVTLQMAEGAAGLIAGASQTSSSLPALVALRNADTEAPSLLTNIVRASLLGMAAFRSDEHLAREQLERATRLAADAGTTLIEARLSVAWGGLLLEIPSRVEQGLRVLERASTLLAHGDAPSLEHIAEHNRGSALILDGRYAEGARHLARARAAGKGELPLEHEVLSCTNEALAWLFDGDGDAALRTLNALSQSQLATVSARAVGFVHLARSIHALLFDGLDAAQVELRRALARAEEASTEGGDMRLLGEMLSVLYATARGEPVDLLARAAELEALAHERGFASFYFLNNLRAAVAHVRDQAMRASLSETLERLSLMLGPVDTVAPP
jgi:serine/threonine protein kinase